MRRDGEQHWRPVEEQRPVDFGQDVAGLVVLRADQDAVGVLEVGDRRALAQELGVGGDRHALRRALFLQQGRDPVAGANRHGRFGYDDDRPFEQARQLLGRCEDIAQVGMAVAAARRSADRDEYRFGALQRVCQGRW